MLIAVKNAAGLPATLVTLVLKVSKKLVRFLAGFCAGVRFILFLFKIDVFITEVTPQIACNNSLQRIRT